MSTPEPAEAKLDRLDAIRVEGQSYDDVVSELIDIYEAEELTLQHGGDAL